MNPSDRPGRQLASLLAGYGLGFVSTETTGYLFQDQPGGTAVLVDVGICELASFPYVEYTARQNQLSHIYSRLFRFMLPDGGDLADLSTELDLFLSDKDPDCPLRNWGRNRQEQDPDPTPPEAMFEIAFAQCFGYGKLRTLHREFEYHDLAGSRRFVDYALFTDEKKFAIELNGESYHHPPIIGPDKYRSQLFKQNSLVADGFVVFRWSMRGMKDQERMILELGTLLGCPDSFRFKPMVKADRALETIDLYEHQRDALEAIQRGRRKGKNAFLVVLPTGTGKTEIFIKDIERLAGTSGPFRVLVIVPTRKLRAQTIERFKTRMPGIPVTTDFSDPSSRCVIIQTAATVSRYYYQISPDSFQYIVVDEAHHAMAPGFRKVIEHFSPECLLGATATPDRTDKQRLEEFFGEFESSLDLKGAMERDLVPEIRCFRIQSNLDLSEVRFNGRDYAARDLQKTIIFPSRDQLIADTLVRYFSGNLKGKQGLVFCVDVDHAKRMARTLNLAGISARAVSGLERTESDQAIDDYGRGDVRFLCTCSLLTEGWDSPITSILVMARPTFSQVLYTQQIGRGTRKHPGKEALYVLDVVDNYGAGLTPLSIHSLLGIDQYAPFSNILDPAAGLDSPETVILAGLFEGERRIQPVDIFNYEKVYGDHLNEEQLARELFVSTGTVRSWIKKGSIQADHSVQFGRRTLSFFAPESVAHIRADRNLSEHSAATRKEDFLDFIKRGDYTFSFKMVFLLSFLKHMKNDGEADLDAILGEYRSFYMDLLKSQGLCDRPHCPYNKDGYLDNAETLTRSLLENPFEKFERKRFLYHCKDLAYIGLDGALLSQMEDDDFSFVKDHMGQDLKSYYGKLDIPLPDHLVSRLTRS